MQGYGAYKKVQGATVAQNGRDTEYRLLAQVTGNLIKAEKGECTLQERLNAVLRNERVWAVFLDDVSHPENRLPAELKRNLASLAIWVMKETKSILDDDGTLEDLIEINRQIMAGLKPRAAPAATDQPMAMVG